MLIRQIFDNGKRYISTFSSMPRRNIQNIEDVQVHECKRNLPEHKKKLPQRPSFLKNLFLGKFDTEFLAFPEPQSDERYKKFIEWMQPIENYITSVTSATVNQVSRSEAFGKLKEFDILRARIQQDYNGLNMSHVETLKILETVAPLPWLSTSLIKNNIIPIDIISKYGNEAQKRNYLPKIGDGDLIPTFCITEVSSGINVQNIKTTATLSECRNFWVLNGKKIFVANGRDSNLFLVVARCAEDKIMLQYESLSTYIVESSHEGITCSDAINTVGQPEVHVCTVEFKDTRIPKENMLGEIGGGIYVLTDVFGPGNNRAAGEAIGILQKFLSLLTTNILGRRHLDRNMHEFEGVGSIITEMTCSLYCMESVAYFTNSINDLYENQELEMEKAVMETYCVNKCVQQIYNGLQLIGVDGYLKDNPYIHLYQDALGLSIYERSVLDDKIYIALLGLQHIGKNMHEHVMKARNYLRNPGYMLKTLFFNQNSMQLNLYQYVHPSFRLSVDILEESVIKLVQMSMFILEKYGAEISSKQMVIARLADVAIDIYVLIAVLARASRSYCIGVRNAEQERYIASFVAQRLNRTLQTLEAEIINDDMQTGDALTRIIAEAIFQEKGYMCKSPLTRTY